MGDQGSGIFGSWAVGCHHMHQITYWYNTSSACLWQVQDGANNIQFWLVLYFPNNPHKAVPLSPPPPPKKDLLLSHCLN